MKKTLFILTVLALGFTACNKADLQETPEQNPETFAGGPIYKVNISASLGPDTKAVAYDDVTGGLASTFRTTDNIKVFNKTKNVFAEDKDYHSMSLHANADAKTANLVGELAFYKYPNYRQVDTGDKLLLMYNMDEGSFYYTVLRENPDGTYGQKGTLAGLNDYDYATAEVTITGISGAGTADSPYTLATSDASFTNIQSMFKLTFTGMPDNFSPSIGDYDGDKGINSITIHSAKNKLVYEDLYDDNCFFGNLEIKLGGMGGNALMAREANGAGNVVYAALRFLPLGETETDEITFTIETTAGTYLAKKTSPVGGFQNGKYYTSTIEAYPKNVNLASIGADFTARDGQVLSGALNGNHKISIADGATVTLDGATITCLGNGAKYAGITCIGDATILLSGTNHVKGGLDEDGYGCWPGIFVPAGKTLIIDGSGSLDARTGGATGYNYAPGIGGIVSSGYPYGTACGNIEIRGGSITASGGYGSAGIGGSAYYDCGTITITGTASVTATGDENGPGIGSGLNATCGDITISTSGTVMATGGQYGAGIGTGYAGGIDRTAQCGNILISKGTVEATGGVNAAGIGTGCASGSGNKAQCGNITITNTVTRVTAIKGNSVLAVHGIGAGYYLSGAQYILGTVKFGDVIMYNGSSWTTTPTNGSTYDGLGFAISTTTNSNDTWTLIPVTP